MPNFYNFNQINGIKQIKVNPQNWINPLYVEYGLHVHAGIHSCIWRVKDTKHTFIIPVTRINYISQGDFKKHFEEVLETFREDYIGWKEENWYIEWMKEYYNEYKNFIIL